MLRRKDRHIWGKWISPKGASGPSTPKRLRPGAPVIQRDPHTRISRTTVLEIRMPRVGHRAFPAKSVGLHGKPERPYATTDASAREATSKSPFEGLFIDHIRVTKRPAGQANDKPSHTKARSTPTKRPFEGLCKYHHWLSNRPPKDLFGRVTSDPEK